VQAAGEQVNMTLSKSLPITSKNERTNLNIVIESIYGYS